MHGKVPTRAGLIDPITLEIEPLKPEHFATWSCRRLKYDLKPSVRIGFRCSMMRWPISLMKNASLISADSGLDGDEFD